jgi:hypothetical protein
MLQVGLAYSAAFSLPCSISSTGSEGAIQLFVLTLYTDACTPWALCSEKSRNLTFFVKDGIPRRLPRASFHPLTTQRSRIALLG